MCNKCIENADSLVELVQGIRHAPTNTNCLCKCTSTTRTKNAKGLERYKCLRCEHFHDPYNPSMKA